MSLRRGITQAVVRHAAIDGVAAEMRLLLPLLVVAWGYIVVVRLVAYTAGLDPMFTIQLYGGPMVSNTLGVIIFGSLGYTVFLGLVVRERQPLMRFWRNVLSHYVTAPVAARFLVSFVTLPLFVSAFTSFKGMIPLLHPFAFDEAFAHVDRLLHFGIDPWRMTYAVLGDPVATYVMIILYSKFWFAILWLFLVINLMMVGDETGYARFALAWVLSWVLIGSVAALALSSAGPIFYDRVVGTDLFVPLMERLENADQAMRSMGLPVFSVIATNEYLWNAYVETQTELGTGISAMPSMHVGMVVLMALRATQIHRWLGWLMWGYAAVVLIGSVHLAWHYAIDGYVAAILVLIVWRFSGQVIDRLALAPTPRSA